MIRPTKILFLLLCATPLLAATSISAEAARGRAGAGTVHRAQQHHHHHRAQPHRPPQHHPHAHWHRPPR